MTPRAPDPHPTERSWLWRFQRMIAEGEQQCQAERFVGSRLTHVEAGRAVFRFDAAGRHHNPTGVLHGGFVCHLVDSAMGTAYLSTLPGDAHGTNTGLHVDFLRPTIEGPLEVEGHVVHQGRTTTLLEATARDGEGRLVARASSRFVRVAPPPP